MPPTAPEAPSASDPATSLAPQPCRICSGNGYVVNSYGPDYDLEQLQCDACFATGHRPVAVVSTKASGRKFKIRDTENRWAWSAFGEESSASIGLSMNIEGEPPSCGQEFVVVVIPV